MQVIKKKTKLKKAENTETDTYPHTHRLDTYTKPQRGHKYRFPEKVWPCREVDALPPLLRTPLDEGRGGRGEGGRRVKRGREGKVGEEKAKDERYGGEGRRTKGKSKDE